jgi:5-dehydro-2-deoxygluconokinase
MLVARDRRRHTVVDLDYRAMFWPSVADARAAIGAMIDHATVAVGNRTECDVAIGTGDPNEAADRLLQRGVEIAVVKMGGEGVLVATEAHRAVVPPVPVEVVCGLGAGDAFGGALCHGLLSAWEPEQSVVYANAAGAIVASRLLCSDAMPTTAEVDGVVEASHAAQ